MDADVLGAIDRCCDAMPRRNADVEEFGALRLFVREGSGMPLYARPARAGTTIAPADVEAVRARQRELGVPEAFEWIDDLSPTLTASATASGLDVLHCPLLAIEHGAALTVPALRAEVLTHDSELLADARAVSSLAFGGAPADAGVAARAAATATLDADALQHDRSAIDAGDIVVAVGIDDDGAVVASGSIQHDGRTAEIVGIGTLPAHRGRGFGGAVTARLAHEAFARGFRVVFLSAGDDAAARVYERVGFARIGTAGIAGAPDR